MSAKAASLRSRSQRTSRPSSEHKKSNDHEMIQRASHRMSSLQRLVGNQVTNGLIQRQPQQTSNVIQRYDAPPEVTFPIQQKPYYRIHQILTDLHRVVAILAERPPRYVTAESMVRNIYSAIESWFGDLMNSKRLMKVFRMVSGGPVQVCWDARNAIGEMNAVIHRAQYEAELRGETNPRPSLIEKQLAMVKFAVPYFEKLENAVSYELEESENFPDVPTKFTKLPRTEAHVLAWLVKYRAEIASAAAKFKIDRRAVAGAIAWEAIIQVKSGSWRAVGPGKPHIWEFWGTSAIDEAEEKGYLPDRDDDQQKQYLKTPAGSTEYIAGVMGVFADISSRYGLNIRNDPGVLTTIYHGWRPSQWEDRMKEKSAKHVQGQPWDRPVVANPMGIWVDEHLPYLEEAVGFTAAEGQTIGEKPHGATGEGKTAPLP